jgi:neutral trehalase
MHLIDEYGFIPNGSRVYYLNRSQPPYFSSMVLGGFLACNFKNLFSR